MAAFVALGLGQIRASAPTFDEPVHLASGWTCLNAPAPCLNHTEHPPLAEAWAALPLLGRGLSGSLDGAEWRERRLYAYADRFLFRNSEPADGLLGRSRLWVLLSWGAVAAWAVVAWAWSLGGPVAGVAAALLFALQPVLVSNFSVVATDAPSAALFFLAFLAASREGSRWRALLAGALAGLAAASKYNMAVLPALLAVGFLFARDERSADERFRDAALASSTALLIVLAACRGDALDYAAGVSRMLDFVSTPQDVFFLGARREPSALYFPAALLLKTPLPALSAAALGIVVAARRRGGAWLLLPAAAYLGLACLSRAQLGVRHVLPVYPFLVVLGGLGAAAAWEKGARGRMLVAAMGAWLAAGTLANHPWHLSYFNELAGGPARGHRLLVDSNFDWGQDLKPLAAELARRGNPPVMLAYFGDADPGTYGLRYAPIGRFGDLDRRPGTAAASEFERPLLAVSATHLHGAYYRDPRAFAWLEGREPDLVAGRSLFLYDLTGDATSLPRLAALLREDGSQELAERWAPTKGASRRAREAPKRRADVRLLP